MRRWILGLPAAALALSPSSALACSVCFNAREEVRIGYLVTTGVLSLLPLALAGGTIWWLWRAAQEV